jgi:hypothetical protein
MTKMNLADLYYEFQRLYREVPFITQEEAAARERALFTRYKELNPL